MNNRFYNFGKHAFIISALFVVIAFGAEAQKMMIEKIEIAREKLIVHYILDDSNTANNYQVSLYSSKDNFAAPLTRVTGDVGNEVKPGAQKKIEWNILQELGNYKGPLSLELRGGIFVPIVKLTGFSSAIKYKRGKTYPILWTSGNMGGQIDIDLLDGQERVNSDRNIPNTGKYEYAIPGSVKAGSNYRLKFTNTRNRDEYVYSPTFKIVHRIPTLVKAAGVVIVGGVAFVLGASGGSPSSEKKSNDLPTYPTDLP
ncbi:MAG TPA: Ser-Thr-rich GPI-anchored membrane family protein [Cyclobacteriaceae bacterium]|nr:Ser-Thr-rich GPI-anchored membrane family protein [Cyclobacteriaceae bacterium]